jgi:hypothetical protein
MAPDVRTKAAAKPPLRRWPALPRTSHRTGRCLDITSLFGVRGTFRPVGPYRCHMPIVFRQ